jgi:hypothetical protein
MKILGINSEWQIAIDSNGNFMPERYVVREEGEIVNGKEAKEFEGWVRQGVYFPNELQSIRWISRKINFEGADQHIIDSMQDLVTTVNDLLEQVS